MNVLIVGSGGREHALAWKVAQSPRLRRLFIAPGNAGTAALTPPDQILNVALGAGDGPALASFCREESIELAIIGPEAPLAAGLTDVLQAEGVAVFGPGEKAARIEASKAYAKAFMLRHGIPTGRFAAFSEFEPALQHLRMSDYKVVLKASGLATGKGVLLPEDAQQAETALREMIVERKFGDAGNEILVEERLEGEEVSLLAFTDSKGVSVMPPVQDHKRLLDGDHGPNTGGMGAYAPAQICTPAQLRTLGATVLQRAVDALREEGAPFVGVLYAGIILAADGPHVLEFNCRFGDPETQALMPLLQSDLLEICMACAQGRLADIEVHWRDGAAACVVLASEGYPGKYPKGREIYGLDDVPADVIAFHAGTDTRKDGRVVTSGGRVLGITGQGGSIGDALASAYEGASTVRFEGMQYRADIGLREVVDA
ncbi:MAG: phosphoribosylamine--glycine ligase [Anaerolineales bacterium]|jgi:phosphoribosylamine--glycine ligase|nr:phosphoribosylamine--glycine ligase [Anaerolineales bacterium]